MTSPAKYVIVGMSFGNAYNWESREFPLEQGFEFFSTNSKELSKSPSKSESRSTISKSLLAGTVEVLMLFRLSFRRVLKGSLMQEVNKTAHKMKDRKPRMALSFSFPKITVPA